MTHPAILPGTIEDFPRAEAPARASSASRAQTAEIARIARFSTHWTHCQPTIRAYLASFVPDASALDDCLQEIAMIAWRKGPVEQDDSVFLGHCLACARRIGLATLRKKRSDRLQFLSPDVAQSLADAVAMRERAAPQPPTDRIEALRHCLDGLKPDQRNLIELRYNKDGSLHREAERLGKSSDTIYKRLERLRTLLRQCVTRRMGSGE